MNENDLIKNIPNIFYTMKVQINVLAPFKNIVNV